MLCQSMIWFTSERKRHTALLCSHALVRASRAHSSAAPSTARVPWPTMAARVPWPAMPARVPGSTMAAL